MIWLCDSKITVLGDTIKNCWVKSQVSPVISDTNFHNMMKRKCCITTSNMKETYKEIISKEPLKISLDKSSTTRNILNNEHKTMCNSLDKEKTENEMGEHKDERDEIEEDPEEEPTPQLPNLNVVIVSAAKQH